jgi:hypothetical protein
MRHTPQHYFAYDVMEQTATVQLRSAREWNEGILAMVIATT